MEPRPVLATAALDDPRASVGREVREYLSIVAGAHARLRHAIADATGVLSDEHSQLAAAAALQVRLTQRFLDAQRGVLALSADTDAKVARVVETAGLEAAMLGLDIHGRVAVGRSAVPDIEPRLQSLLETWWSETHRAGDETIARAHVQASQWVEVAHLVAVAVDGDDVVAPTDSASTTVDVAAVEQREAVEPTAAVERLPVVVHDALTDASHHDLEQRLATLLDALADAPLDEAAAPLDQADEATHAPAALRSPADGAVERGVAPDGFDMFWGSGEASVATEKRRSVVIDAIAPMVVVSLILVAVLAWIG